MKAIMVATDFSERSDRALRRATLLARQFAAAIDLVHVVDADQPRRIVDSERDGAEALLSELAATLGAVDGVSCQTQVILSAPFAGVLQAVEERKPDLLVLGPHRRQVLRDVFIGTTAERTIRNAPCPVLMVNAMPASRYRHVLLTTDLSDGSRDALKCFAELGIGTETLTTAFHVFDAPVMRLAMSDSLPKEEQAHYLKGQAEDAARRLAEFMASAKLAPSRQIVRHEATTAPHEILTAAASENADLIVVSTHGRRGLAKLFLGSVAEQVLRLSTVDVLAIPPLNEPS